MKKIILAAISFLPVLVFAQGGKFEIEGTLGTFSAPAKAYLQYRVKDKTITDSVNLKDGKFHFQGVVEGDPVYAILVFNAKGTGMSHNDYKTVFIEKGTITVTGTDLIATASVAGTKTNDDNARYATALKPVNDAYDALEAKQKAATPEQQQSDAFEKENNKAEKEIEAQESALNKKFIQDNPDSFRSLITLESYAYGGDYPDIQQLFDGLSTAEKETEAGKKFAERLPKLKAVALGAVAPEFAEADTSGKVISLSSFRGKYVLIDFWASWCGPCRHENPNVVKAFNRFKGQNFTIIGVSLDRPGAKDKWLKAIHKDGLTWTQVSDLKFWDSKTAGLYVVRGIPQNFLLDPNGKIIAKNLRGDDLENKLEELFGKI
ncbi:MAG TPA: TlpA disulfide reductase family protein [Mucilaginibacter sp.]|jgi:peroxiredoxin/outer membrane murein-binding lipoprotein Lpp